MALAGLLVRSEAVRVTVRRPTLAVPASRLRSRTWTTVQTGLSAWIGALTERQAQTLHGEETRAEARLLCPAGTDVQVRDGIEVEAGSTHLAGRKYEVVAAQDVLGRYRRCLLAETERERFLAT